METLITTSELIEETKKLIGKAGIPVSHINCDKLLLWKREGLLPEPKRCSAGPGKRQPSLWDRSCIDRLQIIANCVKKKRLSRKTAEQALIAAGFLIKGNLLKKHLIEACEQMSVELKKQQRGESTDVVDRASNLERSTRDRMSAHDELVKLIFTSCRLGYTDLSVEKEKKEKSFKSIAALASFFRPDALQELIKNSHSKQFEEAYQNSDMVCSESLIAGVFDLMYGQINKTHIPGLVDNPYIDSLLKKLEPKPSGKLRSGKSHPYSKDKVQYYAHLIATLCYLVYNKQKEEFQTLFMQSIIEILMWSKLSVPENIKNLLNSEQEEMNALFNLPSMQK